MALLLHKTALVNFPMATTVIFSTVKEKPTPLLKSVNGFRGYKENTKNT